MQRCLALAQLGAGNVAPNPLVGAILVYDDTVIGEGYHQQYGEAHAEVNCIQSVEEKNQNLIHKSTLYVSLEPCVHHGKTPPCVDLILQYKIPHVVIGCSDSFEKVNGIGIQKLLVAGVKVTQDVLEKKCKNINKHFFTFYEKKRPYIILKWAQTNDGFIAAENRLPVKISNEYTNKFVHKLRSDYTSILVGKNTVLHDNPSLTTRLWKGKNLVRIIIDERLSLDNNFFNVFNNEATTIIINREKNKTIGNHIFYKVDKNISIVNGVINCLNHLKLNAVIIEGGAATIQHFVDANVWDEAIIITNKSLLLKTGISSPTLQNEILLHTKTIFSDSIAFYKQINNEFL
jgi:diaminohydroxyphosphoribosylaminopyrimidine deaminase / 5-amino-6-(5-phosphoribosylamino)uracil reductase